MVSGGHRSGGLFHGEVAQGRGGEELATPQQRMLRVTARENEGGEGGWRTDTSRCRRMQKRKVDRVASYLFEVEQTVLLQP